MYLTFKIATGGRNTLCAKDCQFDSAIDGKAIKIASMIDEYTRVPWSNIVDLSITAERLVAELETVFAAAGGPPILLRMDNGLELASQAPHQFCDGKTGMYYIAPGAHWSNGHIESLMNRIRKECLKRNHRNTVLEARVVVGDDRRPYEWDGGLGHETGAVD